MKACVAFFLFCFTGVLFAFDKAKPVWIEGREKEMNLFAGFRAEFDSAGLKAPFLRITGVSAYRIFLNGEFAGYGPARGPHGFDRVDEWPLTLKPGKNTLAVEVAGYNINSYYLLNQPSYLQAEIADGKRVVAATGESGFEACVIPSRIQKIGRYSFQRPFSESYRLAPDSNAWRTGAAIQPQPIAVQPQKLLLPRIAPYPRFELRAPAAETSQGTATYNANKNPGSYRGFHTGNQLLGYWHTDLTLDQFHLFQRFDVTSRTHTAAPADVLEMPSRTFRVIDFGLNDTGFIGLTLRCEAPTRIYLAFDEILTKDGDVDPARAGCNNVVALDLTEAGTYTAELFEPNTLRHLKILNSGSACTVSSLYLRRYVNPDADRARFKASDPDFDRIFEAARETFKQNAVDTFTDCPGRERAGWLCDSFFSARVAADLCGNTDLERLFFQNYLLPESFRFLPQGMLPMCYPADHNNGVFIPNWAMWFVIELHEYLARSGDRAMVEALKPRVLALLDFFKKYTNADGLLENLPSWVFIEWSHANKLTKGVNYPSNMTYAEVLDCAARLYALPALAAQAETMRQTIRKQSFNGTFFIDQAVRAKDGTLTPVNAITETCQYYAFYFRTATPALYPELWKTLREQFGPGRRKKNPYPKIYFANAFPGNYLRLELLSREGHAAQIHREAKDYFLKMADLTGTLWENDSTVASCCHGFASHLVRVFNRDFLGVQSIDPVKKTVSIRFTDVPLQSCEGLIPVGESALKLSWKKDETTFRYSLTLPKGFTLATLDTSACGDRAIVREP